MSQNRATRRTSEQGFALVVISALFIAFAVVAAAIIDRSNATQQLAQQEQTRAQLSRISNALMQYYQFNSNLYPCPANATLPASDANYGHRIANCHNTTPAGLEVLSNVTPTTEVIRGMVPISALIQYGLSPEDVVDVWNNKIMYVVNRNLTVPGGAATVRPSITDRNTSQVYRAPDFILISYGRDGMGAIGKNKSSPSVACPPSSVNIRQINCDTDLIFVQAPVLTSPNIATSAYFDDLLTFYTASPTPCPETRMSWQSNTCTALFPATASGSSKTMTNDDPAYAGSGTATCTAGTWALPTGSCSSASTGINGTCGSSNGGSYKYAPSSNLCATGTASGVSESGGSATTSGVYNWNCNGSGGGTSTGCMANVTCDCNGTPFGACGASPHDPDGGYNPPDSTRYSC